MLNLVKNERVGTILKETNDFEDLCNDGCNPLMIYPTIDHRYELVYHRHHTREFSIAV